jgi:hypothetical protein
MQPARAVGQWTGRRLFRPNPGLDRNCPAISDWQRIELGRDSAARLERGTHIWPFIRGRAQSDESEYVRRVALEALARRWKFEDPDMLPLIKACAQLDCSGFVRRAALDALVRPWKDDPDTLPLLKAHAQSDESAFTRRAALDALVRCWKDGPDTLFHSRGQRPFR